jgi:hypothetical protein
MSRDYKTKRYAEQIERVVSSDYATKITGGTTGNFVSIAASGDIADGGYSANSYVWIPHILKPENIKLSGANPPAEDNIDGFSFDRFDRSTEESVYYVFELPGDFVAGTGSVRGYFEFVVSHPPAAVDEVVVMGFEYKRIAESAVFSFAAGTTSGTLSETIAAGETPYIVHKTAYGTCATTGWAAGDTILFRFYRDATNVLDTYDNEADAANNDVWVNIYHLEYLGYIFKPTS